jgi:hypothetical protein
LMVATSAKNASMLEAPPPGVGATGGASSSTGGGAVDCSKGLPLASGRVCGVGKSDVSGEIEG